jgi:hypothetical protein
MAEHDANGATGVNMDIYQERGNQPVVVLACCFSDTKQVKVGVTLHVQINRYGVDL